MNRNLDRVREIRLNHGPPHTTPKRAFTFGPLKPSFPDLITIDQPRLFSYNNHRRLGFPHATWMIF